MARTYLIFFTLLLAMPLWAQDLGLYEDVVIKGKTIDAYTNEPVPFVNLYIESSMMGTASDENGHFTLTFPKYFSVNNLLISAIGYDRIVTGIQEVMKADSLVIKLKPVNYEMVTLNVSGEAKILYGILRKVSTKGLNEYITKPVLYHFSYKNNYIAGNQNLTTESSGKLWDNTGYTKQVASARFRSQSYAFEKTTRNYLAMPFKEGLTNMDELLNFDVVRTLSGVLSPENLYDYKLELLGSEPWDGDTLLRIAYKNILPSITNTGDNYIKYYEGEIFVLKNSSVVLKCVIKGSSEQKSIHGRSFYVQDGSDLFGTDIRYMVTVNYHRNGGEYHLNSINYTEEFITGRLKGRSVTNFVIHEHELIESGQSVPIRDYFENAPQK
jgi:hypothetical protein